MLVLVQALIASVFSMMTSHGLNFFVLYEFDRPGHYVPQLSELIYEKNKKVSQKYYINLKGFIVSTFFSNHLRS